MSMKRARDTQRAKVYRWEREVQLPDTAHTPLTLRQCDALIKRVYKLYDKPAPKLGDGRGRRKASGSQYHIRLPRWARTGWTVLHECAHGLTRTFVPGAAAHGPEFVAVLLELAEQVYGASQYQLEQSAERHKVRVDSASYKPEVVNRRAA